jgi:hypothetical protein
LQSGLFDFLSIIIVAGPNCDIYSLSTADILANANSDYRKKEGRYVLGLSPRMA